MRKIDKELLNDTVILDNDKILNVNEIELFIEN